MPAPPDPSHSPSRELSSLLRVPGHGGAGQGMEWRSMRRMIGLTAACTFALLVLAAQAFGSEITNSADDLRTGWYPNNSTLTPQLVSGGSFGRLWTCLLYTSDA